MFLEKKKKKKMNVLNLFEVICRNCFKVSDNLPEFSEDLRSKIGNLNEYLPSKSKFLCNFTSRSEEDGGIICLTQENYTLPLLKH